MIVRRHANARAFLERAEAWLLLSEIEHGLMLGLAHAIAIDDSRNAPPIYWATVEDDGEIVGCAFRTPPHRVWTTPLPPDAIELLVEDVGRVYGTIPGATGVETTASAFAAAWVARHGGSWSVAIRMRLRVLDTVTFPRERVRGALRLAEDADIPLANEWAAGFVADTGVKHLSEDFGERLIREQRLFFWDDGERRAMTGAVRETPHAAGIAAVYTPPQLRGRGYASMAVASLSQRLLDRGFSQCFLYTDAANPTSNAIYARIGYRPLQDAVEIDLE